MQSYEEIMKLVNADDVSDDSKFDGETTIDIYNTNERVSVGYSSVVGRRQEQQDTVRTDTEYEYIENNRMIAILCDGMGGMSCGDKASQLCSTIIYGAFHTLGEESDIPTFYRKIIPIVDKEVCQLSDNKGDPMRAGTTLVCAVIENQKLFWASVGDSRLYLVRNNEIRCATKDHNYLMLLNEKVERGEITMAEAESDPQKEALISYIGMGGVKYIDMNSRPFRLCDEDIIIICSDGLYRSVDPEEMCGAVVHFQDDTQYAAEYLTDIAMKKNKKHQDNTSVIVIKYHYYGSDSI